jgi:predicted alpha/beta-hydrolase family hydrolase
MSAFGCKADAAELGTVALFSGKRIGFGVARYPFNYNPLRQRRCRIPPNDIGSFGYWAATSLRG